MLLEGKYIYDVATGLGYFQAPRWRFCIYKLTHGGASFWERNRWQMPGWRWSCLELTAHYQNKRFQCHYTLTNTISSSKFLLDWYLSKKRKCMQMCGPFRTSEHTLFHNQHFTFCWFTSNKFYWLFRVLQKSRIQLKVLKSLGTSACTPESCSRWYSNL